MLIRTLIMFIILLTSACGAKFSKKQGSSPQLPPPIEQQNFQPGVPSLPPANQSYPPAVAPAVPSYQADRLNPRVALNGMGEWIVIDGQEFFVPRISGTGDHDGWEPYQNGYWSYDEDRDWTWNSSDRWGWLTDHYGVWRHHRRHGWIWTAFAPRLEASHYQPHCVTWFDEGEYVGWYPYFTGFDDHYRRFGSRHEFDDGYWDGYRSVLSLGLAGTGFRIGITMVSRANITQPRIRDRMVRSRDLILRIAHASHSDKHIRGGRVGRIPGGDRRRSHEFLQSWAPHQRAPVGRAREIVSQGGARILQPHFDRKDERRRDRRERKQSDSAPN